MALTNDNFSVRSAPLPTGRVTCPNCQNSFEYFGSVNSDHFGCNSCKALFYDNRAGKREIRRQFNDHLAKPDLVVGSSCLFDNEQYVVNGFLKKREWEDGNSVVWHEYELYNSAKGFITLAEFSGHWMLIKPLSQKLAVTKISEEVYFTKYEDIRYDLYHSYSFNIIMAIGAFEGNLLEDEALHTWEYTAPPQMVVCEQEEGTQKWFIGAYLQPSEVAEAFQIARRQLPSRQGVGSIQPSPYALHKKNINRFGLMMAGLVLLTAFAFSIFKPSKELFTQSYPLIPDSAVSGSSRMIASEPFKLDGKGSLEISVSTQLNNTWLEAGISLINDGDGSAYDCTKSLEHYSGTDDGEAWSEGSESESALMTGIPAGTYHLNIYPYSEKQLDSSLSVSVKSNPFMWSNFLLMLLLILIVPLGNTFLDKNFEQKRLGE